MTVWQFLNDNFWSLVFVGSFCGSSAIAGINKIIQPILKNRLQIEQERTKQAEIDHSCVQLARVYEEE